MNGVWRVEKNYEARRKSKNHLRRDNYKIDTTIDASYFYNIMTEIASKMNFADSVTVQDLMWVRITFNFSMILVIL